MSVTPPSPGVLPPPGLENGQLQHPEDESTVDGATTETRPRSRPSTPHLQLKSLLRSPGAKKRKIAAAANESPALKEKKESSDLEEEGTASECHEDDLTEGRDSIDSVKPVHTNAFWKRSVFYRNRIKSSASTLSFSQRFPLQH